MKNFFHIHTYRCGHAENVSDEAYVKKAIALDAASITFTDHAPFPGDPFGNRMPYAQLPEYIDTLQNLKLNYENKINVQIGLEIEYLPSFKSYYKELASNPGIDLLMIGQHFYELTPGQYSFSFPELRNITHIGCINAIMQGVETRLFKVVAHPDRAFRFIKQWDNECDSISRKLISLATEKAVILEKNLLSITRKNDYWNEFWELSNQNTATILGLDAHTLNELYI